MIEEVEMTIAGWLARVRSHRVEQAANPNAMAHANLLIFHATDDQCERMPESTLVVFMREASLHFLAGPDELVAYWWYDWQAGHLRMSLTSSPDKLPFRAGIQVCETPGVVAREFLSDHHRESPDWPGWDGVVRVYVSRRANSVSDDIGTLHTTSTRS